MSFIREVITAPKRFKEHFDRPEANGDISQWRKFLLAMPSMPGIISSVLIHNAFLKYYTDIIGLDAKLVGVIYLVFGIWNAINDPAIGVLIDRQKYDEKRGKLLYLMRVTAPVCLLSAFAMIFAQPSWGQWLIFAFLLALLFVYDTAATTYNIAYASYGLVCAPSSRERVGVSVFVTYVTNIGGLLGTLIPTLLLVGNSNHRLTTILLSTVLIINAFLFYVALKPLKETREMYEKENEEIDKRKGLLDDITINAKEAFKSRAFVTYIIYQIIGRGPKLFYFTPFLYMMDYVLNLNGVQATLVDVIPGAILLLLAPFIGKVLIKLGIKRTVILSSVPAAVGFLLIFFVSNFLTAIAAYIVMYFFTSVAGMALGPMLGAVIDEDEQRTGTRKAGMFTGLNALLTIPISGIQASVFMLIISSFGFVSGSETQTAAALTGIKFGAGIIPFAFTLLGAVPLLFSPINKKREMELSEFSRDARRKTVENRSDDEIKDPVQ